MIHKDPFDRILLSQAIVEGITLITTDTTLAKYSAQYTVPAGRGKETTLRAPIWNTLYFPSHDVKSRRGRPEDRTYTGAQLRPIFSMVTG